jgi:cytidine deaminase
MARQTRSEPERVLLERARTAAQAAYCPYSDFPVGAAVETDAGVFVGCNVENASYGLAICAERVALFTAVAAGAREFKRLAVSCLRAASDGAPDSRMPCGACRQVMAEFMQPDATVIVDGAGVWSLAHLLPAAFRLAQEET